MSVEKPTFVVAIPTYDRPDMIQRSTLAMLDRCHFPRELVHIWVSGEAQRPLYDALPDRWRERIRVGARGLVENRRAAELGHYREGTRVLWINDDVFSIDRLTADGSRLEETTVQECGERGFAEAVRAGAKLWGVYAVHNAFYMADRVHTDLRHVVGSFYGVTVRHDAELQPEYGSAKEDYERSLRFFSQDGTVVRMDGYSPKTIYYNDPQDTVRIEENVQALMRAWPQWVSRNPRRKSPYPEILIKDSTAVRMRRSA